MMSPFRSSGLVDTPRADEALWDWSRGGCQRVFLRWKPANWNRGNRPSVGAHPALALKATSAGVGCAWPEAEADSAAPTPVAGAVAVVALDAGAVLSGVAADVLVFWAPLLVVATGRSGRRGRRRRSGR